MERIISSVEQNMREEIDGIFDLLVLNKYIIGCFKAYLFGSIITNKPFPNDIDILIIYENEEQPKIIRNIFEKVSYLPIHFLFLTEKEENEKKFILEQGCLKIL